MATAIACALAFPPIPATTVTPRHRTGCAADSRRVLDRLSEPDFPAIERDYSHPCITAWVPFNESWGVPNLPQNPAERHYVQALYHLTKTLDPTRHAYSTYFGARNRVWLARRHLPVPGRFSQ